MQVRDNKPAPRVEPKAVEPKTAPKTDKAAPANSVRTRPAGFSGVSDFKPARITGPVALSVPSGAGVSAQAGASASATEQRSGRGFLPSPGDIVNGVRNGVSGAVNGAANVVTGAVNGAANVVTGAVNGAANVVTGTVNGAANVVTGAVNGAANVAGNIVDAGKKIWELATQDPGAKAANPINRQNLSQTDKAVINALGLDNVPPGGKVEVEVKATADVAAVLGVEVGAKVTVTVERGKDNPNEFKMKLGGGASVDGQITGDTAGGEANATAGVTAEAAVELKMDLSKPGAATELAAFGAHTGVLAALPTPIQGAALALEQLPGVNLPGEPVDFMKKHLSSVEVQVGGRISEELGGVLGAGLTGTAEQYLKGGGKIEFNDDKSITVKRNVTLGAEGAVTGGVGGGGFDANIQIAGGKGEVVFEEAIKIEPGPPPKEAGRNYKAEVSLNVTAGGRGGEAKMSIDLQTLPPGPVKDQVLGALKRGDLNGAKAALQNAIENSQVTAKLEVSSATAHAGSVEGEVKGLGTGGGVEVGASVKTTRPLGEASVVINKNGITVTGEINGKKLVNEKITYAQLQELIRQGAVQLAA
jgi:hypothetical protein